MSINDVKRIMASMVEKERNQTRFIAPVIPGAKVAVKIAGIVCILSIQPRPKEAGFRVIQRTGTKTAVVIGDPSRAELSAAMNAMPRASLITYGGDSGVQAMAAAGGVEIEGAVDIKQLSGVQPFEIVFVRFDGFNFWYERINRSYSKIAHVFREALVKDERPDKIKVPGGLPAHYALYFHLFKEKHKLDFSTSEFLGDEDRIRLALKHAGVQLETFSFTGDTARVRFTDGGVQRNVVIGRRSLQVVSSGICLSGKDADFDLTALISVFREKNRNDEERSHDDDD